MANNLPITTIPPFNDPNVLPPCATNCIPLYDANGGCVPPAIATTEASVYTACFCQNANVAAFSTGSTGVCDGVCDPAGLGSIAAWFQNICTVDAANNGNNNAEGSSTIPTASSSSAIIDPDDGTRSSSSSNNGGDWLSNHWQWVVFLVVMVVGIAGIWVGACIWRHRYLRKKDRQNNILKHSGSASRPSWGPGMENAAAPQPYDPAYNPQPNSQGVFAPAPGAAAAALAEKSLPKPKKDKKRWIVRERT